MTPTQNDDTFAKKVAELENPRPPHYSPHSVRMEKVAQYGFPYPSDLLMTFVGGSQLHGAKLQARDDTDWYGVFIESPELWEQK